MKRPTLQVGHLQQPLFPNWNDSLASVRPVSEGKRTQKVQELSLSPYTKPGPKFLISKSYFLSGTHQHFVFLLPDQCCEAFVTSLMTVEVDTVILHCQRLELFVNSDLAAPRLCPFCTRHCADMDVLIAHSCYQASLQRVEAVCVCHMASSQQAQASSTMPSGSKALICRAREIEQRARHLLTICGHLTLFEPPMVS